MGDYMDIRYTDKPITPYGGLTTVQRFYERSGLLLEWFRMPLSNIFEVDLY
jgi:hypothetical protein